MAPVGVVHTSVLTEIIHEAKEIQGGLAVILLDVDNAYATMPHNLLVVQLHHSDAMYQTGYGCC